MREERMRQIVEDKEAQDALRAMAVEMSPNEHRTPSEVLREMSQQALKVTLETPQDRV